MAPRSVRYKKKEKLLYSNSARRKSEGKEKVDQRSDSTANKGKTADDQQRQKHIVQRRHTDG